MHKLLGRSLYRVEVLSTHHRISYSLIKKLTIFHCHSLVGSPYWWELNACRSHLGTPTRWHKISSPTGWHTMEKFMCHQVCLGPKASFSRFASLKGITFSIICHPEFQIRMTKHSDELETVRLIEFISIYLIVNRQICDLWFLFSTQRHSR